MKTKRILLAVVLEVSCIYGYCAMVGSWDFYAWWYLPTIIVATVAMIIFMMFIFIFLVDLPND